MANYVCSDCGIMLDAVDEGQVEECIRCGKPMTVNTGNIQKNFGGTGIQSLGAETSAQEK